MSNTSNMIEFDVNENKSSLDNHTSNSNGVLNTNSDKRMLTAGSPEFALSDQLTVLENNNAQHEASNDGFLKVGNLSGVQVENFEESFKLNFSAEVEATKVESINSLNTTSHSLLGDTVFDETKNVSTKTLSGSSLSETKNISFTKHTTLSLNEIIAGHAHSSPTQNVVTAVDTNSSEISGCVSVILPDFKGSGDNLNNFSTDNDNISVFKEGADMNSKTVHELSMSNIINPLQDSQGFEDSSKPSESVADNALGNLLGTEFTSKIPEKEINLPGGDFLNTASGCKVSENVTKNTHEFADNECVSEKFEIPASNTFAESNNVASKVPGNLKENTHELANAEHVSEKFEIPASNTFAESNNVASKVPGNLKENTHELANAEHVSEKFEILASNTAAESNDVASKVPENVTKNTHEFADAECVLEKFETPATNTSAESNGVSTEVPKNLEENTHDAECVGGEFEFLASNTPVESNDVASKMSENITNNKSVESDVVDFAFKLPENSSNENQEFANADLGSKLPEDPTVLGEFHNPDSAINEPGFENTSTNASRESVYSENIFKVPENSSGKMHGDLSNEDFMFKVPQNPTSKVHGTFYGDDFMFKVPEAHSNSPMEQFADFGFKIPENPPTNECDEEFTDAVQFFKDPNSFQFLENIKTSSLETGSTIPRSSLYVNFDPLHSKLPPNISRSDNCELISAAMKETVDASTKNPSNPDQEIVNKHVADVTARESFGNILISFDSPKPTSCVEATTPVITSPPKRYTEDELQQQLKTHELTTQELYLKKQREMESQIAKREDLCKVQRVALEELLTILAGFAEEAKKTQEKIESLEAENKKLREDLKTSTEDLQSVENTFADFHKRYEQCKGMLKTYKENEEHLKLEILDFQTKEKEQKQMYRMLQERTEEMLEKANGEVASVKRAGEAQVAVLKAQLKKAELKISGLESDIKQVKIENSQLGGICDDLMAKVSES